MVPETKAQGCAENLIRGGGPCWLDDDAAGQFRLPGHLDSLLHHHWMLQPARDVSSRSVLLAYLRSAGEAEYRHVRKIHL